MSAIGYNYKHGPVSDCVHDPENISPRKQYVIKIETRTWHIILSIYILYYITLYYITCYIINLQTCFFHRIVAVVKTVVQSLLDLAQHRGGI